MSVALLQFRFAHAGDKTISAKNFRVFVSSPGDVGEERAIAKRVLDRLAEAFLPLAVIESTFWEHEPLLASDAWFRQREVGEGMGGTSIS